MKKEDIKIKSIKTFEGHDGIGLSADIFVGKVKVAHVFDVAYGGCFEYTSYDKEKFVELEEFVGTLPDYDINIGGEIIKGKMNLDILVDEIVDEIEKKKVKKKIKKQMEKGIVYGIPGGSKYNFVGWKTSMTKVIENFGMAVVKSVISDIQVNCLKEGEVILNTNLEALGISL